MSQTARIVLAAVVLAIALAVVLLWGHGWLDAHNCGTCGGGG